MYIYLSLVKEEFVFGIVSVCEMVLLFKLKEGYPNVGCPCVRLILFQIFKAYLKVSTPYFVYNI